MSENESDRIHIDISHSSRGHVESPDVVRDKYQYSKRRRRVFNSLTLLCIGLFLLLPVGVLFIKSIFFPRPATDAIALRESYKEAMTSLGGDREGFDFEAMISREEERNAENDWEMARLLSGCLAVPAIALIIAGVTGLIRRKDDSYRVLDDRSVEKAAEIGEKFIDPGHWMKAGFRQVAESLSWATKNCWAFVSGKKQPPDSDRVQADDQ